MFRAPILAAVGEVGHRTPLETRDAWVGYRGTHDSLRVDRRPDVLVCRVRPSTRLMLLGLMLLLGPGGTWLLVQRGGAIREDAGPFIGTWVVAGLVFFTGFGWLYGLRLLRRDPRFKTWVRDLGYDQYWREYGWPDRCRPTGLDDFECV